MKVDDLRTTLRDLADEAEDLSPPDRLRGIDKHTRRDKIRRRATGAAAALMALTAVGVGVSGIDPWRDESDPPVAQPEPPPDAARVQTITDHGVTIQTDPGNARLIGHGVGWADDGRIRFEVTPTRGDWEWDTKCFVPRGRSMSSTKGYMVESFINGVSEGRGGPCHRPSGEHVYAIGRLSGDREARIATMRERYGVRPGEPTQIELRLVQGLTGDIVKDPDVLLAAGIYETVGEEYVDHGIRFTSLKEMPAPGTEVSFEGYNGRLLDHRVARADGTLALEVRTSASSAYCSTMWYGPEDRAATGEVTMEVVRPDGTTRAEATLASGGDGTIDDCYDGDTVRLTPTSDVQPSKLAIATYELAD